MNAGSGQPPVLSVVVPAFNEEGVIGTTLERIATVAAGQPDLSGRVEVVVVSDGSRDATFEEASGALRRTGLPGVVIELAQNSGSHIALRCGLGAATGQFVAMLSADGQDPPELLPEMLRRFDGADVVWGRRASRRNDRVATRASARIYYWLFRKLTGLDFPPDGLDFGVVRRKVVDALLLHRERNVSLFLLLFNLGYPQGHVDYERGGREGGTSRWTLAKRAKLALDMLASFSAAPIRLVSMAGVAIGVLGLLLGGITIARALLGRVPVSGWASLMVVTALMNGSVLIATALLAEYVWRILDEVRARPLFLVARRQAVAADDRRVDPEDQWQAR